MESILRLLRCQYRPPERRIQTLLALFHHRWALPVLAELRRQQGSKFVTLVNRLGLSRDSLRQTLAALAAQELVARNPGYGHPLRPEYVLTARGRRLAPAGQALLDGLRGLGAEEVGLRKWSLPVVHALLQGPRRFSALRATLPGITSRALALALMDLQAASLVDRQVLDEYPPASQYSLTARGHQLRAVEDLAAALGVEPVPTLAP